MREKEGAIEMKKVIDKDKHFVLRNCYLDLQFTGIIIIIIIIILGISFMQGIYTYIPETNYVPREHCVATILM